MRRIAILDAPSNLGLRPPTETSVPGCAKAPGALRDHGLLTRLGARDAGCLTPPRYDPGDWRPGDGVCHAAEIAAYSRRLADRIGAIIDVGEFPVILGGDCSIVLGSGLAMHRLGDAVGGRIGLVFVDGHSDFRHPGNASYVGAAAGEDLALVTGRGQADLAAIEGRRPYFRDIDVVVLGIRAQDEYRLDLQAAGIVTRPVPMLRVEGAARSAQWARDQLVDCAGFWVHVDMDVLDPAVMPAVDAPEPGGIAFPELELLLAGLVDTPHCLGVEITVFDPDYDPDGAYAEEITSALVAGLTPVRHVEARPDLVAARADLLSSGSSDIRRRSTAPGRLRPPAAAVEVPPGAEVPEAGGVAGVDSDVAGAGESSTIRDPGLEMGRHFGPEGALGAGVESVADAVPAEAAGYSDLGSLALAEVADFDETGVGAAGFAGADFDRAGFDKAGFAGAGFDGEAGFDRAGFDGEAGFGAAGVDGPTDTGATGIGVLDAPVLDAPVLDAPAIDASVLDAPVLDDSVLEDSVLGAAVLDDSVLDAPVLEDDMLEDDAIGDEAADGESVDVEAAGQSEAELRDDLAGIDDPGPAYDDGPESHRDLRPATRPLGSAPLLDSEPLPATRPGMLRPRQADGFSLPAQRPAFDIGPEEPADIV